MVILAAALVALYARPVVRLAAPGERLAIELPDGSRVELNSGSSLQYARGFGDVRRVHLEGEAFFEVIEAEAPFVVETFNAEVRVLGTRFGVRAWPDGLEAATTVALASGRVRLAPRAEPDRAVKMVPGETRRVAREGGRARIDRPGAATVDDAVAWRRGDLVFKDRMLGVVLADVERRFGVEVRLAPERLARTRLNLALRDPESAEAVVRDLAMALGLAYRETATGFELFEGTATRLLPDVTDAPDVTDGRRP